MAATVNEVLPGALSAVEPGYMGPQISDTVTTVMPIAIDEEVQANDVESGSDDKFKANPKDTKLSGKRRAQDSIFAAWMSKRAAKVTRKEVLAVLENAEEETLSIRALMSKQNSTRIIKDPREYQLELFEKAKTQNTIAVLDTGSGKTLIAVLLLKHIIDIELEERFSGKPPRISFFLVDCVTLVFQQAAVLENNLDQKIDRFCGDMGTDLWSGETWKTIFAENMVIVCTAEILYQCLMHSFITLGQINLLIFDEAHHAKKNHAYARLIKDFYIYQNPSKQPKIFGMTASPVDSKQDEVQAAKELETMLHSRITTASNLALLRNSVSRPHEILLPFSRLEYQYETPLCREMKSRFGDVEAFAKHFVNSRAFASQLGEWCADQIWCMALVDEEERKLERKTERAFLADQENRPMAVLDADLGKLKEAKDFIAKWDFTAPDHDGNNLSSKVKALLSYLNEECGKEKHGKCIIFVNKRWTARLLREMLPSMGAHYLRPDLLIGTKIGDAGDIKVSFRKQLGALNKFRKGEINCLIATSIAEEGLDIPDCNLVIRFDLYSTLIQYIQSRGRARHIDSKYVHMVEAGNKAHLQLVQEMRRGENKMRSFCEALPADRLLQGNGQEADFETAIIKERGHRKYVDPETGATLTYASSLVVLAHFISCLPSNGECIPQATYYISVENRKFVCEVILPDNSPIHSATGRPSSKKSIARRSAAFEACFILRQKGIIDGNLVSTYHKLLPQMRNARLALTVNKSNAYTMKIKPKVWEIGQGSLLDTLYLTVLELESPENLGMACQPLAMLTRTRLPDFPPFLLNLQIDRTSNLLCTSRRQAETVDGIKLNMLDAFTLRIFKDVFNKTYETNKPQMSYWLAPIVSDWKSRGNDNIMDWSIMKYVVENTRIDWSNEMPAEHYVNRYLIDRWNGGLRYFSLAVEPDMHVHDPVPEVAAKHKNMSNILEYTVHLFAKSRNRQTFREDQPVLRAHQLLQRINWLDDFTEEQQRVNTKAWLCLEPLTISALPIPVVTMARMFPGIITRLESYLIAMEAFQSLGISATAELALEAFTKDSDNTDDHKAEQIHVQRGLGKNYERLEFIGDCFLKMATSISLFSQSPEDNEFEYHVNRMVMICNKNLLETALDRNLYQYVRSVNFSRRNWYPQGLKLLEGKGVNKTGVEVMKHYLADKTIADVCEAMIGAALLSYKEKGDMDMAVKAVTALVRSPDHDVSTWADYYPLYEKPKYQVAEASASHLDLAMQIERKHAYRFKYPRLLRSAFIHPSQPFAMERIPCYQRLEFLGDALLDMASISFLFHRHPDKDPQWLTEHKMAMVSNKFLAALSVKLGFHKHLRHSGAVIEKQNRDYVVELQEAEAAADGARDYWTNTKQPPKVLSDIVESVVGAIFVDSEFNYNEVERFFDAHVRWFFEDISIYDTFANNHPTTYLHKLLTLTFGCTEYRLKSNEVESVIPGGAPISVAGLIVHNEVVADGQASSSKQAKVKASSAALKMMLGISREEYRLQYDCDCKEGAEKGWVGKEGDGVGMVGTAI